jgi:hypothetical protein
MDGNAATTRPTNTELPSPIDLTKEGLSRLQDELTRLRTVEHPAKL